MTFISISHIKEELEKCESLREQNRIKEADEIAENLKILLRDPDCIIIGYQVEGSYNVYYNRSF